MDWGFVHFFITVAGNFLLGYGMASFAIDMLKLWRRE